MPRQSFAPAELLLQGCAEVGEGPFWDDRSNTLHWVDIPRGRLHVSDLDRGVTTSVAIGLMLGAAVPREAGTGWAVAYEDGFGFIDGDRLHPACPVLSSPLRRMNDAKCDSRGRLWAGSTAMDFEPGAGALWSWDGLNEPTVVTPGLALPNGIGWSPDDRTIYVVDSIAGAVLAAAFDADEGAVSDFRILAEMTGGLPDGLAVDAEGCLWVALWGGGRVAKLSPAGREVGSIAVPVSQPSSCAIDPNGRIAITSARAGLSDAELREQPLAGSVFVAEVGVAGVPTHRFEGPVEFNDFASV